MRLCGRWAAALVFCLISACSPAPEQADREENVSREQASEFFRQLEAEADDASTEATALAEPQMACEASTNAQDRALIARATEAALADARPFARGLGLRSDEAWVSATAPDIACGSLWLEAEGGRLSYYYANGGVYGRWRVLDNADRGVPFDQSSPFARIREVCQAEWRTCEIAR
jgi:hypothetical protein